MRGKNIVILISGRGSNMLAIARNVKNGILKDHCQIKNVFSNDPNAAGLVAAKEVGLSTKVIASKGKRRTTYNALLQKWLQQEKPDLIVLAGYMRILPAEIIKDFPKRIINIHPADTAEHQGLHGYDWAWNSGMNITKITVHFVDEGLDTGNVIAKKEVDISDCKTIEEVEQKGLKVEHQFYSECLRKILTTEHAESTEK